MLGIREFLTLMRSLAYESTKSRINQVYYKGYFCNILKIITWKNNESWKRCFNKQVLNAKVWLGLGFEALIVVQMFKKKCLWVIRVFIQYCFPVSVTTVKMFIVQTLGWSATYTVSWKSSFFDQNRKRRNSFCQYQVKLFFIKSSCFYISKLYCK